MHIVLYSPAWGLRTYPNGIVTYVHWMRMALRAAGHRVSIVTGALDEPEQDVHLVVPTLGYRARSWLRAKIAPAALPAVTWGQAIANTVRALHDKDPVDVLEMEESFGWFAEVSRQFPFPVVVKLHGPAFLSLVEGELSSQMATTKIDLEGQALRTVNVLTSPARATLDTTIARYALSPFLSRHVVNPLSLPAVVPEWELSSCDRKNLLFVGRFDSRKGGDLVLQAFARLLRKDPSLTLTFVGPDAGVAVADGSVEHAGPMRARLFSEKDAERIVFTGRLAPDAVYGLRSRAFATMVASRWENQSYTLLEAMLQGCPVVSTNTGGHGEIIQDGISGLLCEPDNAHDLAAKLQLLLDDPERAAAFGRNAKEHVRHEHLPAYVAAQTLEVYAAATRSVTVARTRARSTGR